LLLQLFFVLFLKEHFLSAGRLIALEQRILPSWASFGIWRSAIRTLVAAFF